MAQQFSLKKEEFDYELEVRIFYQIFGLKYKLWSGISDKKMTNAAIENKEQYINRLSSIYLTAQSYY